MEKIIKNVNETFDRFSNVGPWFLRITLGISFLSYGYAKFPLPSEMLISFGFTKLIAVFVPLVEVIGGLGIILTGFMKGLWGKLLTRIFAFTLTVLMMFALVLAHSDWLISIELFQNIQIFLFGVSLYFVFKP